VCKYVWLLTAVTSESQCAYMRICTAILMIIEGHFQGSQRISNSKLVLKTVGSCFVALNYYENGSMLSIKTSVALHEGEGTANLHNN
jgi:hypothetical protein